MTNMMLLTLTSLICQINFKIKKSYMAHLSVRCHGLIFKYYFALAVSALRYMLMQERNENGCQSHFYFVLLFI